jgi:protein TonB
MRHGPLVTVIVLSALAPGCASDPGRQAEPPRASSDEEVPAEGPTIRQYYPSESPADGGGASTTLVIGGRAADGGPRRPLRGCDGGLLAEGEQPPPMNKPALLAKAPIAYTEEAAAHQVAGVALVKCVIELDGSLDECRIVKGLPYMNEQILASLDHWSYTPVIWCGHPQRVEIVIPIRLAPGQARPSGRQ